MTTTRTSLRRLTRGRAGLAALVLVGAHLAVLMILLLIWLVGPAPIFNGMHWIPALLASVFLIVEVRDARERHPGGC